MNQRNGPNLKVIALTTPIAIVVFIGLWILSSIWGAVNSRAQELVLLGQYPDVTYAIGPALIEVVMVPVMSVALVVGFFGAVIFVAWKWIQGVARQF